MTLNCCSSKNANAAAVATIPPLMGTIDYDYPRKVTHAYKDTDETYWGKYVSTQTTTTTKKRQRPEQSSSSSTSSHDDHQQQEAQQQHSGFHLLSDGTNALATRLLLARKAERCIDAQYYLIKDDDVGKTFLYTLLQAADRGVRVRLLIDDMFTQGYDAGMLALSEQHPNFEIRVFNPFVRSELLAGQKSLPANLADFERINRRMHNKTYTIDNQITVLGGRNIADEYFGNNTRTGNFHDDDVMAIGPIVQEVSNSFDEYWNHAQTALPIPAFVNISPSSDPNHQLQLKDLREYYATSFRDQASKPYAEAVRAKVNEYLTKMTPTDATDSDLFRWAPYQLVVDSPNKGLVTPEEGAATSSDDAKIITPLMDSIQKAQNQLIVVSPYFVLDDDDMKGFMELQQRGVEVIIITNSLAANNMFMVHGGYGPIRKPLLEAGIQIYEVRPDSLVWGSEHNNEKHHPRKSKKGNKKNTPLSAPLGGAVSTLHTKEFIVDNTEVFVGSFNYDPRSIHLNTECGVIIGDPTLAKELSEGLQDALPTQTYELFLNKRGKLRWRTTSMVTGKEHIEKNEPQTTFLQRTLGVMARIVPKSQL